MVIIRCNQDHNQIVPHSNISGQINSGIINIGNGSIDNGVFPRNDRDSVYPYLRLNNNIAAEKGQIYKIKLKHTNDNKNCVSLIMRTSLYSINH